MEHIPREGGSTNRPILFTGDNYPFWKNRMRSFLKSIDESVWDSVENGWEHPTHEVLEKIVLKPKSSWTKEEKDLCNFNNKAVNALHASITPSEFRRISKCETAKEAWDTLEVTYEGTTQVKTAKLQVLVTQFEECRMKEDESFVDFEGRLIDIVNSRHNLGDSISDPQVIRKIMRSLPNRFMPKIVSIEDTKDTDLMNLSEFLGSIKTFEHNHCKIIKRGKDLAFKSSKNDSFDEFKLKLKACENENDVALIVKNFQKAFIKRKMNLGNKFTKEQKEGETSVAKPSYEKNRTFNKTDKNSGPRCYACEGIGHIAAECANTLKKNKEKGLNATWDDSDSDEDTSEKEEDCNDTAFVANTNLCSSDDSETDDSDSESEDEEGLRNAYKDCARQFDINLKLLDAIRNFQKEILELKELSKSEKLDHEQVILKLENDLTLQKLAHEKVILQMKTDFENLESIFKTNENYLENVSLERIKLEKELASAKNSISRLVNGTAILDEILSSTRAYGDRTGLGYNKYEDDGSLSKTVFVKANGTNDENPKCTQEKLKGKIGESPNQVSMVQKGKIESRPNPNYTGIIKRDLCNRHTKVISKDVCRANDSQFVRTTEQKVDSAFQIKRENEFINSLIHQKSFPNTAESKTFVKDENVVKSFYEPRNSNMRECFHCGKIGHSPTNCGKLVKNSRGSNVDKISYDTRVNVVKQSQENNIVAKKIKTRVVSIPKTNKKISTCAGTSNYIIQGAKRMIWTPKLGVSMKA